MNAALFIDTGAFYAKYVPRDHEHKKALGVWQRIQTERRPCITTAFVVAELITLLTYRFGSAAGLQAAREIYGSHALRVVSLPQELELKALEWLARFADQRFSMTDALSFAFMEAEHLSVAFTFDHHFRVAGYQTFP